uniref:NADH dehydrogenase subunit 9 n=1 Tax=Proteomonas sulcata TaxID=77928 RepID=A0A2P1G8D2_9CRYP|nr:NADH dehydrogenase subunit 9 [Proteomonas sulcata]AVM81218.1 NADH dehydrogenase subunit 9 [Proteomonas sulcata]
MSFTFKESLEQLLKDNVIIVKESFNEIEIQVQPTQLKNVTLFLRNHEKYLFKILIDIFVIDYPQKKERFEVIYSLLSIKYSNRLKIKVCVDELTPLESLNPLYQSANWFEREIWDMHGVFIEHHPDLRRILTDYGFDGYPLRKDFPLSGYNEVRYDDSQKRVIYEPLELSQEFRVFNFTLFKKNV